MTLIVMKIEVTDAPADPTRRRGTAGATRLSRARSRLPHALRRRGVASSRPARVARHPDVATAAGPRAIFPHAVSGLGEVRIAVPAEASRRGAPGDREPKREGAGAARRASGDEWGKLEASLGYRFRDSACSNRR